MTEWLHFWQNWTVFLTASMRRTQSLTGSQNGASKVNYIVEFECRYNRISQWKMELPDAVLAFKLIDTTGLNVKNNKLVLTACPSLTFDNMKAALKRIEEGASELQVRCCWRCWFTGRRKSRSNPQNQTAVQGTDTGGELDVQCAKAHSTWSKDTLPDRDFHSGVFGICCVWQSLQQNSVQTKMAWSLCQWANTRWVTENKGHKKCQIIQVTMGKLFTPQRRWKSQLWLHRLDVRLRQKLSKHISHCF